MKYADQTWLAPDDWAYRKQTPVLLEWILTNHGQPPLSLRAAVREVGGAWETTFPKIQFGKFLE